MEKSQNQRYEYLFAGGKDNSFFFTTEHRIFYEVKFKNTSYLFDSYSDSCEAFELGVIVSDNPTPQRPPLDLRVSVTVAAIFYDFMNSNTEQVVVYICDSSDRKQAARHRKFSQWFDVFGSLDFVKVNAQIIDHKLVVYYTSLIIHKSNPKRILLTEAFIALTDDQQK